MQNSNVLASATDIQVVNVVTTHVVSCDDWVTRTSLINDGIAIVVAASDNALWLVSTTEVLAPDPAGLRTRSASQGGPPVDRAKVTLVNVSVTCASDHVGMIQPAPVDMRNPNVVTVLGCPVVAIPIHPSSSLAAQLAGRHRSQVIDIDRLWPLSRIAPESQLFVQSLYTAEDTTAWSIIRTARFASRHLGGFAGRANLTALDQTLAENERGCAVVVPDLPEVPCIGLTVRLRHGQAAMVPVDQVAELIGHKRKLTEIPTTVGLSDAPLPESFRLRSARARRLGERYKLGEGIVDQQGL